MSESVMLRLVMFLAVTLAAAADASTARVQGHAIKAHTAFLADDLLEGREAGERGYDIAAAYVAAQFAALGLEPGNGAGGYFQTVPLRERSLVPGSVSFEVRHGKQTLQLENGKDVAIDASRYELDETLEAPLVFAGWGISAPGIGQDDYAGLNVKGKAVVVLEGAPASFPGALRAHYTWPQQKEREAAARGAIALLTLKSPARERWSPFERTRKLKPLPQLDWSEPGGTSTGARTRATISLSPALARDLFARAGRSLERIFEESEANPPRGFRLPMSMRMTRKSTHRDVSSPNVLGILRGTDPRVADEYVVVAAHLDHDGVGEPVNGDRIYNGAVDNAGGVATMLEVARVLRANGGTRRSVLFFATTAEEKGLLGSEFFVAHPTLPLQRMVAAISVDGLMAFHDFGGIVALGAELSTLGEISRAAAKAVEAVHVPDPIPDRGNLALSDQYPFLTAGVPVLFPNPAPGQPRSGADGLAAWESYESNSYHQPSDDMKLPLRWDVAQRWGDYIEGVVRGAADAQRAPTWYEGDVLADVFATDRPRTRRPAR
ncbi:MAG TPA: M28 family metallopeptidase [Steroidobacteraceae bacterium]|nr:M28 family metallopeptidase [Steroidobacteraceae bacterium]